MEQAASRDALLDQSERVAAAADASKVSLDDMELLAAEQREEEAACVRQCAADVAGKSAQVGSA